jgi:hypothetical protein
MGLKNHGDLKLLRKMMEASSMTNDDEVVVYYDSIQDSDDLNSKNRARVGTVRPSAMLFTSGIGSTVDLPHLSVMIQGLEYWERYYKLLNNKELIVEPRLLKVVKKHLGPTVNELRHPPWMQSDQGQADSERIGIPATLFPRWLRCTGCNLLAQASSGTFVYENTNRFRPDQAGYFHKECKGRGDNRQNSSKRPTVPARFLLACIAGHLDEFPYIEWVHGATAHGLSCSPGVVQPLLDMIESPSNVGPQVSIKCRSCKKSRSMQEATGEQGEEKLPQCRGRHAHLGLYEKCEEGTKLMLLGSANQWFPSTLSLLVMPTMSIRTQSEINELVLALPDDIKVLAGVKEVLPAVLMLLEQRGLDIDGITEDALWKAFQNLQFDTQGVPSEVKEFNPIEILEPEWQVMNESEKFPEISEKSVFKLESMGKPDGLDPLVEKVVAVERLKKVNAFIGFTRVDAEDRIGDGEDRVVPIWREAQPTWVPATEDRGEGVFLQFNEGMVADWEEEVFGSKRWKNLRAAHERNFRRRMSKSAAIVDPDSRLAPPRYWALHALSHILIREMAIHSGYGAASLTERIYAWRKDGERKPAAGILISTTSSDSEGTLGGLVELSNLEIITEIMKNALRGSEHCSSDPLCSHRMPVSPEEFLHGAACHFCLFVSETSCEKSNRFLDRAMLRTLADSGIHGMFDKIKVN